MNLQVTRTDEGPRIQGPGSGDVEVANRFLAHLEARVFSLATVRAYAFDVLNFLRFCATRELTLSAVQPAGLFDYLDWQARPVPTGQRVVRLTDRRGAAPATMNRRIAAVRALFTYLAIIGDRASSPVPAARGSSGLRATRRGLLGHLGPGRPRSGGSAVWQYRNPSPAANNIKGHVAFGGGVKVKRPPTESRDAATSAPGLLRRMFSGGQSR